MSTLHEQIESLVDQVPPIDELARQHRNMTLDWLASTDDIFRRNKPRTPSPHLVSYFLLVDRAADAVLLCDHRLSALWLPTGGHVEPGEHPLATVHREVAEELGILAEHDPRTGEQPFFLTVTETVGDPDLRHVDVSLWYALAGKVDEHLLPDDREFRGARWWTTSELQDADRGRFEPHLPRALAALNGHH